MPIDEATQSAVRALWEVGARHGRPPAPVPEADPWEADDPVDDGRGRVSVVLDGVPEVVVHLHRDGTDLVVVEGSAELEVPRRDTALVLDGLLAGRARRRRLATGFWRTGLATVLGSPAPSELVVAVDDRVYAAPVLFAPPLSAWLLGLPVVDG